MPEPDPAPAAPPPLPPAPIERINDFPDRLSPMLVKELRQGLRTNTFVVLFLSLQGLLALVLLTAGPVAAAEDSSSGAAGDVVSRIVFCIYAFGVLLVQPLRGISAVAAEQKQNTIDLMVLTRLSSWRIVWGKWSSIVSQSALILMAVLPYLILRYFFGGMQLFGELALLAFLFLLSASFTAFTVGLSAVGSALLRGLVVVCASAFLVWAIPAHLAFRLPRYVDALSFTSTGEFFRILAAAGLALYGGYFFLELGATAIAPAAENRSTRKRLLALLVIAVSLLAFGPAGPRPALAAALMVTGFLALDVFGERGDFPAGVCRPFVRRGLPGRLAGRFLYPGWPTGALFLALLAALVMAFVSFAPFGRCDDRDLLMVAAAFGAMLFPAAMIQLFARATSQRFTIYVSLLIMSFLLTIILSALQHAVREPVILWAFAFIPMVFFPLSDTLHAKSGPLAGEFILFSAWGVAGVYFLVILFGALPRLRALSNLERKALEL